MSADQTPMVDMRATTYTVSILPEDDINYRHHAITVEYRRTQGWAVCHVGNCLGTDGEWVWDRPPDDFRDEWIAEHRFDGETAMRMAVEAAPHVECNGVTALQAWHKTVGRTTKETS